MWVRSEARSVRASVLSFCPASLPPAVLMVGGRLQQLREADAWAGKNAAPTHPVPVHHSVLAPCPPQVIFTPRWPRLGDLPPLPSHCQRLGSDGCLLIGVSRGQVWTGTDFSGPGSLRTRAQRSGRRRGLGLPSARPSSLLRKPRPRQHPAGDPGAAPRPLPPGSEAASGTTVPRDPLPNRLAHADCLAAPSISHPATGRRLLTALNGQSRERGGGSSPSRSTAVGEAWRDAKGVGSSERSERWQAGPPRNDDLGQRPRFAQKALVPATPVAAPTRPGPGGPRPAPVSNWLPRDTWGKEAWT